MAGKKLFRIETPRGQIHQTKSKGSTVKVHLKWQEGFGSQTSGEFSDAQDFIDSECLRHMDSLTPRRSGYMIKSAILGTTIGSGAIEYLTPYARRQYYENNGSSGNRGKLWFERMKTSSGESIRKGAAKYIANH